MSTMRVHYLSRGTAKGRRVRQTREFAPGSKAVALSHEGISDLDIEAAYATDVESVDFSWNQLTRIDMSPLSLCPRLKRLDLSWNRLSKIDLSSLADCSNLETVLINGNKLIGVDLRPLESKHGLTELQLARNRLSKIDLTPLRTCSSLKALDLRSNSLIDIDFEPLASCSHLRELDVGANRLSDIDLSAFAAGVHNLKRVEYARQKRKHCAVTSDPFLSLMNWNLAIQVTEWKESSKFTEEFVESEGWEAFADALMNLETRAAQARRGDIKSFKTPASQMGYLLLDMRELRACPQSVRTMIDEAFREYGFANGRRLIYERAVEAAADYIETAPSTKGFDVRRMANTAAARLVPRVLEKRKEEVERVVLRARSGSIELKELWNTYYGWQILNALRMGETTNTRGLAKIQDAFDQISVRLNVERGY